MRDVAEAQAELLEPGATHGLDGEPDDLGIGAVAVGRAKAFDARLAKLAGMGQARSATLEAKGRAVIAIAGFHVGDRMPLQIKPRHRHREVWPEAKLLAGKIGEDIGAAPDRLANPVEKDVGGLENRGRNLLVAGPPEASRAGWRLGLRGPQTLAPIQRSWAVTPCGGRGRRAQPRRARSRARRTAPRPASSDIRRGP